MAKAKKEIKTTKRSKTSKVTTKSPSKADQTSYKEIRTERIRNRQMGRKS